ncbi:hypothetical protein [Amycolatopsis sp. cmx-11-12]|uniref:hypothetical protein n=1 Tax=Amycolatopsis sp. cmx-11-12 TaxID=2785795 RepID=UPI0039186221
MTKETSEKDTEKTEKQGRIVQVTAAAMAAITAALLGSTLGVAGTVAGAGLASVITTLGGELYLRSLQRTKDAALKARVVLTVPGRRRVLDPSEQETVRLTPAEDEESSERKFKPRWAVIAGVSVVAFVVALVAITGFEGATGKTFGGGNGTTIGKIIGGGQAQERQDKQDAPPATSPSETEDNQPEKTPSSTPTPSTTPTAPTTTQAPPTTPSTTPSTSQAPPTTPSAPASGTPAP